MAPLNILIAADGAMSAFLHVFVQERLCMKPIVDTINASAKAISHGAAEASMEAFHVFLPMICTIQSHSLVSAVLQLAEDRVIVNLFLMALQV